MVPPVGVEIAPAVAAAVAAKQPIVALETAILTHGLPRPANLETALAVEETVRQAGALPATIGVVEGRIVVGLSEQQLATLAAPGAATKASVRDLPVVVARRGSAGTTVAATVWAAHSAGIAVVVTGGIGGVHRGASASFDVSADLPVLAQTPICLVCAGAKTILDLPATVEWLETAGVPVLGYGTDDFPGFFLRSTGLPVSARVDSAVEVAAIVRAQRVLGLRPAVLVAVPVPAEAAIPSERLDALQREAEAELAQATTRGKDVTPFLLAELERRSAGETLRANVALIRRNAEVGAAIARELAAANL